MKLIRSASLSLSVPIVVLVAAACSKTVPVAQPPQTTSTTIVREPAPAQPPAQQAAPAPEATQPPASSMHSNNAAPAELNDDQIATTVAAASMSEIELSRLAQVKAKDPRVKKFAGQMVSDHTDATHKQVAMMNKEAMKIEENPMSMQLMTDSSSVLDSLKTQTGADFDRTYMDAQVKENQQFLDLIDHKLVPGAKDPELKAFIEGLRPTVERHLMDAQNLQKSLSTK
ncbi:MAG: DUF4142 domain-containing protein [Polyangiaceae bacterium]